MYLTTAAGDLEVVVSSGFVQRSPQFRDGFANALMRLSDLTFLCPHLKG
jgi:hypothetical protein